MGHAEVDDLPDELLLMILAAVDRADTLLRAVPLVSKRWHRLSRDRRAWASARHHVGVHRGVIRVQDASLLQHAPRLRALHVDVAERDTPQLSEMVSLSAAVRCMSPVIEEVHVEGIPSASLMVHVERIVKHCESNLRAVRVGVQGNANIRREVLAFIASMPHLRELDLHSPGGRYSRGSLEGSLPHLRRLVVAVEKPDARMHSYLAQELLEAAAGSLRQVDLPANLHLQPSAAAALSRCVHLETLKVHESGVPAVKGMVSLRELHLFSRGFSVGCDVGGLAAVQLDALRCLRLDLYRVGPPLGVERKKHIEDLIAALCLAAPRLEVFRVRFCKETVKVVEDAVLDLLGRQAELRTVHIAFCTWRLVAALAELPKLREVEAVVWVPAASFDGCCEKVRGLKRARPLLRGKVEVIPIVPERQYFAW